jgi:SAM-dependent methyltransferase
VAVSAPRYETAAEIARLGNAFCQAQALLTAVELDLFTVLDSGPADQAAIRERLGLHGRGLHELLRLLVALGLLGEEHGVFRNGTGAARFLVSGRPGYIGGLLLGAKQNLYPVWAGLGETLRTGLPRSTPGNFTDMLNDAEELRRYVQMMEGALEPLLPGLTAAVRRTVCQSGARRTVLDVGGGRGMLASRLVLDCPGLTGHVLDLPQLEPLFESHMASQGTAGAVWFHDADFFRDPLPQADVVILGHILHNWPRGRRELLVRKAYHAVQPGGALLVHDRMLDDDRPDQDNLVAGLIMALVTEEGEEYPIGELVGLAAAAGFGPVTSEPLGSSETLVICRKA